MNLFSLVPLLLGAATVLQAVLNRYLAQEWGLSAVVVLNSAVLLVFGGLLLTFAMMMPGSVPQIFRLPDARGKLTLLIVLSGFFGFLIVAGLPFAVSRLSSAQVFVLLVSSQIVTSLVWDQVVDHGEFIYQRWLGAALAIAGAALVSLR